MNNKLILRTENSPYGDITKGSVLSHSDVDNNFIFLKGQIISTGETIGNSIVLTKLDGSIIQFEGFTGGTGTDIYVTGGTYNQNTGVATFTNNTGGTFSVTGFYTGTTDVYITGGTYLNGTTIFTNSTGGTFSVSGYQTTDYYTTGATLVNNIVYFDRNDTLSAYTLNLSGFSTQDIYVTGMTFNNSNYDLTLFRNDNVSLLANLSILASDMTITGGTYDQNTGVATFTNNTGGTFSVSGFLTGYTNYYTTGATLIGTTAYFDRTDTLSAYTLDLSSFSSSTSAVTYTNSAATTTTIGGISAGSTFSAKTMQEMWDALLYPYQSPAFSSFSLGISSPKEIGYDITTSQTFTWGTTNSSNVSANTITIAGYNLTTLTGLANDGSEAVTFTGVVTRSASDGPGTRAWSIQGTNTNASTFSSSLSIRWDYKMYAGTSTNTSLTASQITGLTNYNSVKNGFAGTYNMSAGGYKYFCFASTYGTPSTFVDTSNNLNVGMYGGYPNIDGSGNSYDLVSVTNAEGETTNYKVYRTLNQLGGSINIAVS